MIHNISALGRVARLATFSLVLFLSAQVRAQFPGQGTDTTTSLGQFSIVVNPAYSSAAIAIAGGGFGFTYNAGTNILTSPLLYDSTTTIDRSAPTTVGSGPYNSGLPVGTPFNGTVKASDISLLPPGYVPPAGEDTVFTQIKSFTLASGPTSVTAGAAAPGQPRSVGEVVSNATGGNIGNPTFDFPARSFFDVFVDINVPGVGSPLINTTPLIINDNAITTFPPVVIYTHGNSSAVPIMFTAGNGVGAPVGDVFGLVTLAGHGAGYTSSPTGGATDQNTGSPANSTTFENTYQQELSNPSDLMPLPAQYASWSTFVPSAPVPEPSTGALIVAGMCSWAVIQRRRRCAQGTTR